ncbi:MAG: hypothetical protein DHS20C16_31960 [Phycisphaerae bacterium]|nr:MAG: hypothetical protein DHS20C16_31960 [Phycisphaerae bacterium]
MLRRNSLHLESADLAPIRQPMQTTMIYLDYDLPGTKVASQPGPQQHTISGAIALIAQHTDPRFPIYFATHRSGG